MLSRYSNDSTNRVILNFSRIKVKRCLTVERGENMYIKIYLSKLLGGANDENLAEVMRSYRNMINVLLLELKLKCVSSSS